jgi:hypothetical protein
LLHKPISVESLRDDDQDKEDKVLRVHVKKQLTTHAEEEEYEEAKMDDDTVMIRGAATSKRDKMMTRMHMRESILRDFSAKSKESGRKQKKKKGSKK